MRTLIGVVVVLAGCSLGGLDQSGQAGAGMGGLSAGDGGPQTAPPTPCYGEEVMVRQCLTSTNDPRRCQPFIEALAQCQSASTPTWPGDAGILPPEPPVSCDGEEVLLRQCLTSTNDPRRCEPFIEALVRCRSAGAPGDAGTAPPEPPTPCEAEETTVRRCLSTTNDPRRCEPFIDALAQCQSVGSPGDAGTVPPSPPAPCYAEAEMVRECVAQTNDLLRCEPLFDVLRHCQASGPTPPCPPHPPEN